MHSEILIERQQDVAEVVLNRPEKHNGINWGVFRGLVDAGRELAADRSLRAVVLRGAGPSFCAGLDVQSFQHEVPRALQAFLQPGGDGANLVQDCCLIWRRLPVPVFAQIHGACFGGGLQIALGADFRFASPDARLSIMEVKYGLVPDMGGTVTLSELLPLDIAKALAFTGEIIAAPKALEYGLLTGVAEDPAQPVAAMIEQMRARSPDAIAQTKKLFQDTWQAGQKASLAAERRAQRQMFASRNQKIAMAKAAGKDTPDWAPIGKRGLKI